MTPAALPDLSARQLNAAIAVAEYGSFVAAAAYLGVSQPSLTRTIKQIERALGITLFSRDTRNVAITPAGREFVALARRLLADLSLSLGSLHELAGQQRGQVIAASLMSIAYGTLPAIVGEYCRRHPKIEVHLREGVQGRIEEEVRSGVADFGIGDIEGLADPLIAQPLARDAFYVVLPRGHALARRKTVPFASLREEPQIALPLDSRLRRTVDGAAAAEGFAFRYAITVTQFATLYRLVHQRVGVAIMPGRALPAARDAGLVSRLIVRPRLQRQLGIISLQGRMFSPAAEGLIQLIKRRMKSS